MRRYNTSIKTIMQSKDTFQKRTGTSPIFLSDWDADYNSIHLPELNFSSTNLADVQKYYFWTDEENYRANIKSFFSDKFSHSLANEHFTIGSNGTSCLTLTLLALKESGKNHLLVLTPVYFSTLNLLDELDFEVTEYRLSSDDNFNVQIDKLEKLFVKNSIDVLIFTNPLFGSGVEVGIGVIESISLLCNLHDVCFVMDYVYGGMIWNMNEYENYIFNYPIYNAVKISKQYVFIESISKRLFINGAKFALVFSSESIMRRILRLSIFTVGSMSQQQVNLIPQIYSSVTAPFISNLILENSKKACDMYKLVKTILSDSNCTISNTNCGYFALISVPIQKKNDDSLIAIDILNKTGVLTIPHSRYLYSKDGFYSFRINLLIKREALLEGIIKIKNLE